MRKTTWVKAFLQAMQCRTKLQICDFMNEEIRKRQKEMPEVSEEGIRFLIICNFSYLAKKLGQEKKWRRFYDNV